MAKTNQTHDYVCCSCSTHVMQTSCSYTWKIDNFKDPNYTNSKTTFTSCFNKTSYTWKLTLFPDDDDGHLLLIIKSSTIAKNDFKANIEISIISDCASSGPSTTKSHSTFVYRKTLPVYILNLDIDRATLLANEEKYLPAGMLTIQCDLTLTTVSLKNTGESNTLPESVLANDMGKLLLADNPKFPDVVLCSKGREFKAHKNILSVRSSVFEAMFEAPMKESSDNKVDIGDVSPEVLQDLLSFIYTGTVSEIGKNTKELLLAADKYLLDQLKRMCEQHLSLNIAVDNASDLLVICDSISTDLLHGKVIDFIAKNADSVMKTKEWATEILTRPLLMQKVISYMYEMIK